MTDREKAFVLNAVRTWVLASATHLPANLQQSMAEYTDDRLVDVCRREGIPLVMLEWVREESQAFLAAVGLSGEP